MSKKIAIDTMAQVGEEEEVLHNGQVEFAKYCSIQEEKGITEPYNLDAAQIYIQGFSEWEKDAKREETERIRTEQEQIEGHEELSKRSKPCRRVSVKKEFLEDQQQLTEEAPTLRRSARLAKVKKEKTQEECSANVSEKPQRSRRRGRKSTRIKKEPLDSEMIYDEIPVYQRSKSIKRDEAPDSEALGDAVALNGVQKVEAIDPEPTTLDEEPVPVNASPSTSVEADGLQRPAEAAHHRTEAHCLSKPGSCYGPFDQIHRGRIFADFIKQYGLDAPNNDLWPLRDTTLPRGLFRKCFEDDCVTNELDWDTNIGSRAVTPERPDVNDHSPDSGVKSVRGTSVPCTPAASLLPRQPGKLITDLDAWQCSGEPATQIGCEIVMKIHEDIQFVTEPIYDLPDSAVDVKGPSDCSTPALSALVENTVARPGLTTDQELRPEIMAREMDTKQRLESDAIEAGSRRDQQHTRALPTHYRDNDGPATRREPVPRTTAMPESASSCVLETQQTPTEGADNAHPPLLLRPHTPRNEIQASGLPKPDSTIRSEHGSAAQPLSPTARGDSCRNAAASGSRTSPPCDSVTQRRKTRNRRLCSLYTKFVIDGRLFVSFDKAFTFCKRRSKEDRRRRKWKRAQWSLKIEEKL